MVARIQTIREVGAKQRALELGLVPLQIGPVQQPMRIERVVDAPPLVHVELKAKLGAPRTDHLLALLDLSGRRSVLALDVLDDVLAARAHLRVELERLEVQLGFDLIGELIEGGLQRLQPDDAPGARHVGHEIDLHSHGHARSPARGKLSRAAYLRAGNSI